MNGPDRLFQYAAQTATTTIAMTAAPGPDRVPRGRWRCGIADPSEEATRARDTVGGYHADGEAGRWPLGDLPATLTLNSAIAGIVRRIKFRPVMWSLRDMNGRASVFPQPMGVVANSGLGRIHFHFCGSQRRDARPA